MLEISEDGGANWTQLAVTTVKFYRQTGLPGGAVRHYRVKARDGDVDFNNEWSNTAAATAIAATALGHAVRLSWDNPNEALARVQDLR